MTPNEAAAILEGITRRIVSDVGLGTPWHVGACFPVYRFTAPPTSVRSLERAWKIGHAAGLEFVYAGNAPGHPYDNPDCSECNSVLMQRAGFEVTVNHLRSVRCPACGREVTGIWKEGRPWTSSMW